MAHLLNSCSEFKDVYSARNDKIVNKLGQKRESVFVNLFVNKCVSTSLEELNLPRNLSIMFEARHYNQTRKAN